MAFSSYHFILIFLPLCYAGFVLVHRIFGWNGVFPYLALASIVFYAQFSVILATILATSVVLNFLAGRFIIEIQDKRNAASMATAIAVIANLVALGYFKYTNFFIDVSNQVSGAGFSHLDIVLPVGISFYTFIQIGFLLEAYNGQAEKVSFSRYALFATFFPCVTAGPLVLQREMFQQMEEKKGPAFSSVAVAVGLTLFGIGVFKKVILADSIAPFADAAFDGVASGAAISMVQAWVGSLCYTMQLYFDFSGYCDMAIGIGFMFGIKLPLNFNSPFKATSIADFWRRWHMTMTRFFTTYLYTPSAMKNTRRAIQLQYSPWHKFMRASAIPVTYTFVVAGIWHGAGWGFVVYGLIHGLALAVNHGWREFKMPDVGPYVGWALTMTVVICGLVVFRAPDLSVSATILASMWGLGGLFGSVDAGRWVASELTWPTIMIAVYSIIVLKAPNSQEILRSQWVSCDPEPQESAARPIWRWKPTPGWAAAAGLVLAIAITSLGNSSNFLYYQF
ncbi:MAG: MBOAT family protein [Rhizobiales bacterium]|nr:MBOAT family protein [Hyphomicrobiales bacterium]